MNTLTGQLAKASLRARHDQNLGSSPVYLIRAKLTALAFVTILFCGFPPGFAAAVSTSAADSSGPLEEIIVTARRREENVQAVPIAITVLSQDALQQNNVQSLDDLQSLVPSMSLNHSTLAASDNLGVSIRGQGRNPAGEGVVVYLNEAPIPDIDNLFVGGPGMLFDLENVQVLEGPQGTLFGRNSVGGALLLQTARPTNQFDGHIQLSYGNYNDREVDAAINIPIVGDVLLARIAINGQWRDGYTHLLSEPAHPDGTDANNRDTQSVRGTLTFRPTDGIQNDTILTYSQFDDRALAGILVQVSPNGLATQGIPGVFPGFPGLPGLLVQQQALGIGTALPIDINDISKGHTLMVNNNTRIDLADNLRLRNIFSYGEVNQIWASAGSGTVGEVFDNPSTPRDTTVHQYTEELQLAGKSFNSALDWVVGAFYLDQPLPDNPVLFNVKLFGGTPLAMLTQDGQNSKAAYAQGTYDLSAVINGLKFTGGVRYTKDQKTEIVRGGLFAVCDGPTPTGCGIDTETLGNANSHALTYTVGLQYEVVQNTNLYLTDSRGYREGSFNPNSLFTGNPQPPYGPEYVDNYELGVKSDWKIANIPVRTNANIWYQNYTDLQLQEVIDNSSFITNGARARLWGAELQVLANLTDDLQLGVNYDHLNFQYTNFDPGVYAKGIVPGLLAATTSNRPPNKYDVNVRYHLPLSTNVGNIAVRANWNWQAANGDTSIPLGVIPSFGLLNMNAEWNGIFGSPIDVSLFASNVLNKTYVIQPAYNFQYLSQGFETEAFGEPRMYGIRVNYRFGRTGKSAE
jgi:iron complex outermembrane receptor protein